MSEETTEVPMGSKRAKGSKKVTCKKRSLVAPFSLNPAFSKCMEALAKKWEANEDYCASIGEDGELTEDCPGDEDCSAKQVQLHNHPFKYCVMNNFITGEDFLTDLKYELCDLNYSLKNNDLFQFHQSDAFDCVELPHVAAVKKLLYQDLNQWLREVTKEPLTDKCDTFCSRYEHTDYLLCHDDRCSTRKIAFIYYLNKNWKESDGGTLDLFDSDENNEPKDLVRSILPNWNSFVFFEVSENSHHQVSELINQDKIRVAISGWYHVPAVPEFERCLPVYDVDEGQPAVNSTTHVAEYVNPIYLQDEYVDSIQNHFEQTSEVQLHNILVPEQYQRMCEALVDSNIQWNICGPPNRRHYQIGNVESLPECLQELLMALRSGPMFELLSRMTDLALHIGPEVAVAEEDRPSCSAQVQQWSQGCYTLLAEPSSAPSRDVLDVYLHFNSEMFPDDVGGSISYVAHSKKGSQELSRLSPVANSMSLVYARKSVDKTVKYLNSKYEFGFHTIQLRYHALRMSMQVPPSPPSSDTDSGTDSSTP